MRFKIWLENEDTAKSLAKDMLNQGLNLRQIQSRLRIHHKINISQENLRSILNITSSDLVQTTLEKLPKDIQKHANAWIAATAIKNICMDFPAKSLQIILKDLGYLIDTWDIKAAYRSFCKQNPQLQSKPTHTLQKQFQPIDTSKYSASYGSGRRVIRGTAAFS